MVIVIQAIWRENFLNMCVSHFLYGIENISVTSSVVLERFTCYYTKLCSMELDGSVACHILVDDWGYSKNIDFPVPPLGSRAADTWNSLVLLLYKRFNHAVISKLILSHFLTNVSYFRSQSLCKWSQYSPHSHFVGRFI